MRLLKLGIGFCLLLAVMSTVQAGVVLTVSPQFEGAMTVGQEATFAVQLSGLPDQTGLDFLSAQVVYDPERLGDSQVIPGPIVSDVQPVGNEFLSAPQSGKVDATYMTLSTDPEKHIDENGTFYTFSLKPLKAGTGTLDFFFVSASAFATPVSQAIPVTPAAPLAYTVVAVPEPSTWALLALLLLASTLKVKRRTR